MLERKAEFAVLKGKAGTVAEAISGFGAGKSRKVGITMREIPLFA